MNHPPMKPDGLMSRAGAWHVLKISFAVGLLAGAAFTAMIGISVFRHPSVDNDPGMFVYASPYIFLLAAVPSFLVAFVVCAIRQSYLDRSA